MPKWAYGEIMDALGELEGKTDDESNDRRGMLLERLMCADMAMGPSRRTMAAENKADQPS